MNEHRRSRRKPAYLTIPVVNKMTGQTLGRIGNLSADGMLLVCEAPITQGALFQLGFELSNAQALANTKIFEQLQLTRSAFERISIIATLSSAAPAAVA